MSCDGYPTAQTAKTFNQDAITTNEMVTLEQDRTNPASDGKTKKTMWGIENDATIQRENIENLAETQRKNIETTFAAQFAYKRIGNISAYVGDTLQEAEKLNSYQYPDDSGEWYGPVQSQTFPITIPADPTSSNDWALVNALTSESLSLYTDIVYKASGVRSAVENMVALAKVGSTSTIDGVSYFRKSTSSNSIDDFQQMTGITPAAFKLTSDSDRIEAWLENGGLMMLDKDYIIDRIIDVTPKNPINLLYGDGRIIVDASVTNTDASNQDGSIIQINGNGNKLKSGGLVHKGNFVSCLSLINFTGNNNRTDGFEAGFEQKHTPVEGEQYRGTAIRFIGDSNTSKECYGSNVGTGISANGKHNSQFGNHFTNYCRLIVNGNKSRHHIVDGNYGDAEGQGDALQGCSGFVDNRSARFGTFTNNSPENCGEHGAYLQGDGFVWDKSNFVKGANKCAVKIGAKPTDNFAYLGETLPMFDSAGNKVNSGGQYATTNAKVFVRAEGCNRSNSSDGAFCMQTNVADIQILGFDIRDSGNTFALRSLYLESESAEANWVMANVKICDDGICRNSGDISLACSNGLYIGNVDIGVANLSTYGKDDGTKNSEPLIKIKTGRFLTLDRSEDARVEGGKWMAIGEGTAINAELINVKIVDQSQIGNWDTGRIRRIEGGEVNWLGTEVFNINSVNAMESVEINVPNCTASYALQYNFNGVNPSQGQFNDNIINCPLSNRPVRIGGNVSCANSNTIIGKSTSDFSLTIEGDGVSAVGNTTNAGKLRLNSNSSGCNINHPKVSVSGDNHTIYGDDVKFENISNSDKATNCFAVGRVVTDNNIGGNNKKIIPT